MQAPSHRLEFAPPHTGGMLRAVALAIVAHAMLLGALTLSVQWRRELPPLVVQAELWSASAMRALQPPEPAPPPPPEPVAKVAAPPVVAPPPIVAPPPVDIALEQEKKRRQLEREREQAATRKAAEARRQAELQEAQRKAAAEKLKTQQADAARRQAEQEDAKRLEALRQENIRRMTGLAGAAGASSGPPSTMSASQAADYRGRIMARIRPNIAFSGDTAGNPTALVEVRTAPDGTIINRRLLVPSGVAAWDEAALRAIDKTEILPRNIDGKVPPVLEISIRPKD